MNPKQFIKYILIAFPALLISHFLIVDNLVIQARKTPYSYKQFILQSLSHLQNKVIVTAGSNALHGIDSSELALYFNAPVFTYADNASYPIRSKILNIEKVSKPGDTIILPLEWKHYSATNKLTKNYTSMLADKELKLEFYYNNAPIIEKIRFIFTQYPLNDILSGLFMRRSDISILKSESKRLNVFKNNIESSPVTMLGNSVRNGPEDIVKLPTNTSCDSYIFSDKYEISDEFKSNLKLLQKLSEKGVNIYFTWPVVVNYKTSACYVENKKKFVDFHSEIQQTIANYGFKIIGEYQDSHFMPECFLNTYYHIKRECTVLRTKKLIENIQQAGITPYTAPRSVTNIKEILLKQVNQQLQENAHELKKNLPAMLEGTYKGKKVSKYLILTKGWSKQNRWGVWSDGYSSTFEFKISKKQKQKKSIKITLNGRYFNGKENTGIIINKQSYKSQPLLNAEFSIPTDSIKGQVVEIELKHHTVISPKELGKSKDARNLKFGLTSITLESQ